MARFQDSHIMYNPAIFNSQPNTKIKFFDDRTKRHTEEDLEEAVMEKIEGKIMLHHSDYYLRFSNQVTHFRLMRKFN